MKLVTFSVQTVLGRITRLGAMTGDDTDPQRVIDLNHAYAWLLALQGEPQPQRLADAMLPGEILTFLSMGHGAMEAAREVCEELATHGATGEPLVGLEGAHLILPLNDVRLEAPVPMPTSYRDFFAFEQHVAVGYTIRQEPIPEAWYQMPVYYKGNPHSIVGPDVDVQWPSYTEKLDYELELAVVIGRRGRNISKEKAHEYIAGYTILNDFSARDIQKEEMQCRLGPAKAKDFATGLGPWLVTPDEVGDARNLRMTAKINGEQFSDGNSGDARWTFEDMIVHASKDEDLWPGDLLGSGTVGSGCSLEHRHWMKPGDTIELAIEKLGVLRHRVMKPVKLEVVS
ncbi:MAG: fumarylacetoacetate hydrolase family protein [Candidatus Melainabacteria bacterium]